jgi:hypothetical protein
MSRFKIYQIDYYDPQLLGKRRRRTAVLYASLYTIFMILLQVGLFIFHIGFALLFFTTGPLLLGISIYLHRRHKASLEEIKTIGEIEFTKSVIRKRIGDSLTEYNIDSIEKIELQKHIPAMTPGGGKAGYFSYILKIIFTNSSIESIVVSDKSVDRLHKLSIVETMKTLKKIIRPEILIRL